MHEGSRRDAEPHTGEEPRLWEPWRAALHSQIAMALDQTPKEPKLVPHQGFSTEQKVNSQAVGYSGKLSSSGRGGKGLRKAERFPILQEAQFNSGLYIKHVKLTCIVYLACVSL